MDAFIVKEKKCTVSNLLRKFGTEGSFLPLVLLYEALTQRDDTLYIMYIGAPFGALKSAK